MTNLQNYQSEIDLLRQAFSYQSRFKNSTIVLKAGYPDDAEGGAVHFSLLLRDIAILARSGLRFVIVCSAKNQIDAALAAQGIESSYCGNTRVTTAEAMPYVEMAAFDVASRFMTALSASRVDAVIGNFVRARSCGVIGGVDTGSAGAVDKIYASSLRRVLDLGMVPILPCVGWSPTGKPYNVPSAEIAAETAAALDADKLFIAMEGGLSPALKTPESVERAENGRIIRITPREAKEILALNNSPNIQPDTCNLIPESLDALSLALKASEKGVERAQIIDSREEGALLRELFTNLGAGTMLYTDEYESIRPMKNSDISDVLRVMEPQVRKGLLIPRTPEQIQEKKDDYVVFEIDSVVHACAALHDWGEKQAEIAAVASDSIYSDMGKGKMLVKYLLDKARRHSYRRVFVLTIGAGDWFEALGFREASVESLPPRKRSVYNEVRKSKVLAIDLE
jgi:amino-acid N-acetyltransferase